MPSAFMLSMPKLLDERFFYYKGETNCVDEQRQNESRCGN
jgi:hypothetical protein